MKTFKAAKAAKANGETSREEDPNIPSEACKKFLIELTFKFFEVETTVSLDQNYMRYEEQGLQKFKVEMTQRMLDTFSVLEWIDEMQKRDFTQFVGNRVHDALWNGKDVLGRYGKQHRANGPAFEEVILKVDLFNSRMAPFSKSRNKKGSLDWWSSAEGLAELHNRARYVIALPSWACMIAVDDKVMKGGYATIQRVRIEGCNLIPTHWKFAAKKSNHHNSNPQIAMMEYQNESMAVRIPHAGVIRFAAMHAVESEGYSYWWNGRTLRHMLNLDNEYSDDIHVRVA